MITRIHSRICRITIPQFPNGSSPILYHIAPTWIGCISSYLQSQFTIAIVSKPTHELLDTYHPCTYMTIKVVDCCTQYIVEHLLAI